MINLFNGDETKMKTNELKTKATFDWGSCQYDEAARIYGELLQKTDKELNALIKFKRIDVKFDDIIESLKDTDTYTDSYDIEIQTDLNNALDKATNVEDLFDVLRNQSWDLWSAAQYIASHFVDYEILEAIPIEVSGPVLNQLVQSENGDTAVACFLLKKLDIVKDDSCYVGFDT